MQNGDAVNKLVFDTANGILWVAADKGLYAVDCNARSYAMVEAGETWSKAGIADICLLSDARLCVAYRSGAISLIDKRGHMRLLAQLPKYNGNTVFANDLLPWAPNIISCQTAGQSPTYLLHTDTRQLERLPADSLVAKPYFRKISGDTLFLAGFREGFRVKRKNGGAQLFSSSAALFRGIDNVIDIQPTTAGRLYLLRKPSNLYHLDLAAGRVDTLSSEIFAGRLATCLYRDAQSVLWVGTNKGLIKVTEVQTRFTQLLTNASPISVRSLAEDEDRNLYAGTYSGLFRLGNGDKQWQMWSGMLPYAMLNMPGPYLYFVGEQRALFRVDKLSKRVETGFYRKKGLPPDELRQAYALASDSRGVVWIGTSYGLVCYAPGTNTLAAINIAGLPLTEIRYIRIRNDGHLWLCTRSGLYEVDTAKGVLWHVGTSTRPALTSNTVNYVDEDSRGRLWLCTDGGGVNIISKDRRQVTALRVEDGLSDNTTYQLMWQGPELAWISTFNGLSTYDLRSNAFYNYYADDGLTNNEFNHNAFLRTSAGRMMFGGINGVNAFAPDSIIHDAPAARLFASTITKWDNKARTLLHLRPADTNKIIELGPFDHSLSFNLALTDYHNPENENFLYRIKGLFDEWVSLNSQRSLRLDGLAPGEYTVEIKALDSRGAPSVNMLRYRIRVAEPFYKSWWFFLLLFLLASVLLAAFFRQRLQSLKRMQQLRQQIASDLHDEVGSLLTRITMTSDNLQYSSQSENERSSKLQKIAALSRTAASSMSDILWAIDARNDYTGNLADRMREHAEEMLTPLNLYPEFDFVVNQRMSISSELRQQLYLIYKEAINNIVKHAEPTEVRIKYYHSEQRFTLSVVNNGYAEKERLSTKGQGLKNIRMRADKLHARSWIQAEGTNFNVVISDS